MEKWCFGGFQQNGSNNFFHFSHDFRVKWSTSFELSLRGEQQFFGVLTKRIYH